MSSSHDKTSDDRSATKPRRGAPPARQDGGNEIAHGREKDVGVALRSVYQQAVDEQVPDEFMDLLGKLG